MLSWLKRPQPRPETLACSFCGRSQHRVKQLVAGPNVYICDACVDICSAIISAERTKATGRPLPSLYRRLLDQLRRGHRRDAQAARTPT